jgi:hypothetical protein
LPDHLDDERIDVDRHQRAPGDVEALDRLLGIHGSDQTRRGILRRQAGGPCLTDWARVLDIGIGDEHLPRITAAYGANEFVDEAFAGRAEKGDCGLGKAIGDREVDVAAQGSLTTWKSSAGLGACTLETEANWSSFSEMRVRSFAEASQRTVPLSATSKV